MAQVKFERVVKRYGSNLVIKSLDLDIQDREFLVLVGPSGCGKSTALRMIAGLEEVSEGKLWIGDRVVNDLHPKARDVAMVFQNYALYPHMTVRQNMAFALELRKVPAAEIAQKVNDAAKRLEIDHLLDRKPKALSGGQRQRVALGRAIVRNPAVFLMDEPLSNLDAKLRVSMRAEIKKLHQQLQSTFVYVTHDQTEALTMGDRIAVFQGGEMQQVGSPHEVYHRPVNSFVATFIGSPSMNLVQATALPEGDAWRIKASHLDVRLPSNPDMKAGPLLVGLRPEHFLPSATPDGRYEALVEVVEPMGSEAFVYLKGEGGMVTARLDGGDWPAPGQSLALGVDASKLHLFTPNGDRRLN